MLVAEKVVDGLDGIEGSQGNLNENGRPVAHGTIPESGQLKSLELLAALGLLRDEASGLVDIVGQIEGLALIVLDGADEVDRIEVGALGEHLHILLV